MFVRALIERDVLAKQPRIELGVDQRRVRVDPMDIVRQPNHRAHALWLADGVPQPVFTAETRLMEELSASTEALSCRAHHEQSNGGVAIIRTTAAATSSRRWCGPSTRR